MSVWCRLLFIGLIVKTLSIQLCKKANANLYHETKVSFLFTCCLLFIISSPKIVVSCNFLSILILFWAVFICSFSILRDSQLESDVCHLQYKWSSNSLVVEIQPFNNSKFIEKIHNVHRGLDKCLAIHTIPSRFSSFLKGCILFHLGLINVEIL